MKEKTISILAIIAIFSAHVANSVLMKYMFIPDDGISWLEKTFFISFIMLVLGFITVFEWDVLFPDSRDFANLMVLPVKLRTLFTAKFISLCGFVGLFALGANVLSTLPFWFYLPKWQAEGDILFFVRFIFVHLLSMFAASFFIFFLAVFLIGILMLIMPERLFRTLSLLARILLMVSFIFIMIYVVSTYMTDSRAFQYLAELKSTQSQLFYLFPPVWFTGLYETLLGNTGQQFRTAALLALISLVVVAIGFFLTSALVYKKYCRSTEVKKKVGQKPERREYYLTSAFNRFVLRNSIQRGIFYFFEKTLRRSMVHKMRLATFAAVGFALGLVLLVMNIDHPVFFSEPNGTLLSIALLLTFFLLQGMKRVVNIPYHLEANWIFRLTEGQNLQPYAAGLRKGIIFILLVPLFVLVAVFSSLIWGLIIGTLHGIFVFVMSVLLMEILFLKHNIIPFACSYLPGQAKVHILWPVYIISFFSYVLLSVKLERLLFRNYLFFFFFICAAFIVMKTVRICQSSLLPKTTTLVFVEEPEPALITLLTCGHE